MTFRADLHCHTCYSDGSMTPKEIIHRAREVGLSALAITDHDNVRAYPEAVRAAKEEGIWLGTGVEFSSVHLGKSVHVLGYDFDPEHADLEEFCRRHLVRRQERNDLILAKLNKRGMSVDSAYLNGLLDEGMPVGRPHIALELVKGGYVESVQEAFARFLGDGRPCFDPGRPISTEETLDLLHRMGGKAFLAHPHLVKSGRLLASLFSLPFDGIECYYSRIPREQEEKWIQVAQEHHLLVSGGSDFHGAIKPLIPLGCSWVDRSTFDQIFERYRWTC